jgi:tol-pal system protein YbgF
MVKYVFCFSLVFTYFSSFSDDNFAQDIEQLQQDINRQKSEYNSLSVSPSDAAEKEIMLQTMSGSMQKMTGKMEEFGHNITLLQSRMDKLVGDMDHRLRALEQKAGIKYEEVVDAPDLPKDSTVQTLGTVSEKHLDEVKKVAEIADNFKLTIPQTAKEHYAYSYKLLLDQNIAGASQSFSEFIKKYPKDDLTNNAYYWLGETYYVKDNYREAAKKFLEGYQKFNRGNKAPDCLLKLSLSLDKMGERSKCCTTLKKLLDEFPNGSAIVRTRAKETQEKLRCPKQ